MASHWNPDTGNWSWRTDGVRTDNDDARSSVKVGLRLEAIALLGDPRPIRVMDAYHGHGHLWENVIEQLDPAWTVSLYRVDKEKRGAGTLQIDNKRLLQHLDLTGFDLFDLDAYGFPVDQLRIIADKAPGKLVLTTRIALSFGRMPVSMFTDLGMTAPSKDLSPTIWNHISEELWEAWLHSLGYRYSRLFTTNVNSLGAGGVIKRYELLIPDGFVLPEGFPMPTDGG